MQQEQTKEVKFVDSSLDDLRDLPAEVMQRVGYQLNLVQHGDEPTDWKPMTTVGPGVMEIRVSLKGLFACSMWLTGLTRSTCYMSSRRPHSRRKSVISTWPKPG